MTVLPGAPAHLVVVDMQEVFGDPASAWFTPRFAQIVEPISRLTAAFSPRTTFTRFVAPQGEPVGSWRAYYRQWPFALRPPESAIWRLVAPFADGGPTVDATTFGKWGPQLAARTGHAPVLVIAGVATDCCVISTALAAADAGRHVRVVADACAGAGDDSHRQALAIMRGYAPLVDVVDTAEILTAISPGG